MKQFVVICLFFYTSFLIAAEHSPKVIAFAQDAIQNDFRKAQVFEVRDHVAQHPELSFIYSDGQGQTSLLIKQIEGFIQQQVDLLVIGTNDKNAVVPVISKAYQAGIPVIILDRGISGTDYTTFINSDNYKIGVMAADYLAKELKGKGSVLLLEGIPNTDVTQLRSSGFLTAIKKHKDISVIRRTGNYLRKDALIEMEKLIAEGLHIDAIFSESDSMLSGVRMVLERYNIESNSIITIGCDYTQEAREAIKSGSQTASIRFPLGGGKTVTTALQIFTRKMTPKHISLPVKLVTENNVNEVEPIF